MEGEGYVTFGLRPVASLRATAFGRRKAREAAELVDANKRMAAAFKTTAHWAKAVATAIATIVALGDGDSVLSQEAMKGRRVGS